MDHGLHFILPCSNWNGHGSHCQSIAPEHTNVTISALRGGTDLKTLHIQTRANGLHAFGHEPDPPLSRVCAGLTDLGLFCLTMTRVAEDELYVFSSQMLFKVLQSNSMPKLEQMDLEFPMASMKPAMIPTIPTAMYINPHSARCSNTGGPPLQPPPNTTHVSSSR